MNLKKNLFFLKLAFIFFLGVSFVTSSFTGKVFAEEGKQILASLLGTDSKTKAPDFELKDLNGTSVKLSDYKGQRPVLLYFWATWCPYCIEAKPNLAKLRQEIDPKEMEILGVNVGGGDSLERVKRYQEGHPAPYPILFDAQGKVSRSYGVQGIPLFIIVDKEGSEVYRGNNFPENPMKYLK